MKIFYLSTSNNASGGSRQALYLAAGMKKRGHEVIFLTPRNSMLRDLDKAIDNDLTFKDLPEKFFEVKKAIEEELEKNEPFVVHAFHNKGVKILSLMGTLWHLKKVSVACVAHRGVIFPPNNPLPYLLPGIDCFAVNSQACLDTLPLFWRKKHGQVVYNGIPENKVTPSKSKGEIYKELGLSPEAKILGTVGNNNPNKGMDILLKAFALLPEDPERYLLMVGPAEDVWGDLCDELGIRSRVIFPGRLEDVANYLQIYRLFILPSLMESSPNVLLEAMCMGLPAVGSAVGGVPEILAQDFVFPPGDHEALAKLISQMENNDELLAQAGQANLEKSKLFTLDNRLNHMEKIYKDILATYKN